MSAEHLFEGSLHWQGHPADVPFDYEHLHRTTHLEFEGGASLTGSAPAVFHGDDRHPNPETLMIASLMQCHFLTFMAVAIKSRLHVTAYSDRAVGRLAMQDGKMRFVEIVLRPSVTFEEPIDAERLVALHDKAHRNCYMSNSVNFPVRIDPVG
ncbi:MAG: OsmC family protein [Burkholderiaceae bacterium]|nr:OsmC family protein [Burkholderiaceae bacterium]